MKYDCYVELVPKGKPPREANTIKVVQFNTNSLRRSNIVSELYETVDKRNNLDSYVIRNYWDIFEVDIDFIDPPWDGFSELTGKLISFDEAMGWKSSGNMLYISIRDGMETDYIKKIENYYSPLNPRLEQSGIVAVDTKPEVKD